MQALFFEMAYPTPPERDALDARPFFERRMADTISGRTRWIRRDRSTGIPYLAPEVRKQALSVSRQRESAATLCVKMENTLPAKFVASPGGAFFSPALSALTL